MSVITAAAMVSAQFRGSGLYCVSCRGKEAKQHVLEEGKAVSITTEHKTKPSLCGVVHARAPKIQMSVRTPITMGTGSQAMPQLGSRHLQQLQNYLRNAFHSIF